MRFLVPQIGVDMAGQHGMPAPSADYQPLGREIYKQVYITVIQVVELTGLYLN
jgi:hypothetical protein